MSVKLSDIIKLMEEFAPKEYKESYDNVGLMVGNRESSINSVLISLDTTLDIIDEAAEKHCELIISHHPILFRKPSNITEDTLIGKKIRKAIQKDINIYASHTNLDITENGINDLLVKLLGFDAAVVMEKSTNSSAGEKEGVGRIIVHQEAVLLSELCQRVKSSLKLPYLRYSGNDEWLVKKVAVINGSGQDYFELAKKLGADCIISGDTTYHYVSDLYEEGIAVIDAGHYGTEWPAMKLFADTLKKLLQEKGLEITVLVSERNLDPYKVI
jgi:dinuclear metal center YbgI/SA1388 family protein